MWEQALQVGKNIDIEIQAARNMFMQETLGGVSPFSGQEGCGVKHDWRRG